MGKTWPEIIPEVAGWIQKQNMFFVATAPGQGGQINCSPKGLDSFRIIDPVTVAWLDLTGSGVETIAHLRDNGRIVIMFCAFEGPPKIVRLHGRGEVFVKGTSEFDAMASQFDDLSGKRSVIRVSLTRVSDSCGFGVPQFQFIGQRNALLKSAEQKGEDRLAEYRLQKNATSIDGLPGFEA